MPRLHVEPTRPVDVKLLEVTGEVSSFFRGPFSADAVRPVCVTPCDLVVDGKRVTKSREFKLFEVTGEVMPHSPQRGPEAADFAGFVPGLGSSSPCPRA